MIRYLQQNKHRIIRISIVLLIVVAGLYLRFERFRNRDLWADEVGQIDLMKSSLSSVIITGRALTQFPGDFFLIYPFYKLLDDDKWSLANPHILMAILGFYLLYKLCNRYFKTIWGFIATFSIVAFNANLIFHAFEIRPYGVLATLSIAVFLVLQYIFDTKNPSPIKVVFISLFIIVITLFHFYGIFMLFFSYVYHFLCSRGRRGAREVFITHLKYFGSAIIISLPLWIYFVYVDRGYMNCDVFLFIHKGIVSIARGVFGNLIGFKKLYFLLAGVIVSFLLPHKDRVRQIIFFFALVILPISLILLSCIVCRYWFVQRLFVWVIPLFAFMVGWSWDSAIIYFKNVPMISRRDVDLTERT